MKNNEEHYRKLERMYAQAPVNQYYRPSMRVEESAARVAIEVRQDFFHAAKAVHGVVYFKLVDDAAFFAAQSLVDDVFVLTVSLNVYVTRPITEGEMVATGRVVHETNRLILAETEVADSAGKLLARGSGAFMRSKIPLAREIGYA